VESACGTLRATTVAPITATSSRRPTISKGSRYSVNRSWASVLIATISGVSGLSAPRPLRQNAKPISTQRSSAPAIAPATCKPCPANAGSSRLRGWRLSSMMTNRNSTTMAPV